MSEAKCRICGEVCVAITVDAFTCDNCGDEYRVVRESTYSRLETELAEAKTEIERLKEKIKGCSTCKHYQPNSEMIAVCLNETRCCRTTAWCVIDRTSSAKRARWPDLWEEDG